MQGITAYQTDYSMAALAIRAEGSPLQPADGSPFKLPMASLDGKPGALLVHPDNCKWHTYAHTARLRWLWLFLLKPGR